MNELAPERLAEIRSDRTVTAGDPCPNGCAESERWEPFRPELLRANADGEISCPACWECFGIEAGR